MLSYLRITIKFVTIRPELFLSFGELKQSDIDLILFYRDEYEKYFDSLNNGEEYLSFKEYIGCIRGK